VRELQGLRGTTSGLDRARPNKNIKTGAWHQKVPLQVHDNSVLTVFVFDARKVLPLLSLEVESRYREDLGCPTSILKDSIVLLPPASQNQAGHVSVLSFVNLPRLAAPSPFYSAFCGLFTSFLEPLEDTC